MKITFREFDQVMCRQNPGVVPLYEHGVDYPVIEEIMGYRPPENLSEKSGYLKLWKNVIDFYEQMGYPYVPIEMGPAFPGTIPLFSEHEDSNDKVKRGWINENEGVIRTMEDVLNPELWKPAEQSFDFALFDEILTLIPPHMKAIGGACGGPFEHITFLMGFTPFCMALYEDEELIQELLNRITDRLTYIAAELSKREKLGIYRFGDDMGYKCATMIGAEHLKKYIFPAQKRVVEAVHQAEKKFLLHSCGKLNDIMDDLIDFVGIDAKHSYEDVILPVEQAKALWGDRIAIMGGIDVDFLCRADKKSIYNRTIEVLKLCAYNGGYAAGSGNTITGYMPSENYLEMLKAVNDFNR